MSYDHRIVIKISAAVFLLVLAFLCVTVAHALNTTNWKHMLYSFINQNGEETLLDEQGRQVVPFSSSPYETREIQPGIIQIILWDDGSEKCLLYNMSTGSLSDFYRQAYGSDRENGLILVLDDHLKFGYIDCAWKTIIPFDLFDAAPFSCGYAWITKNNDESGFINESGEIVISPKNAEWEYDQPFSEGYACVYSPHQNKYGFINLQGEIAIPFIFDDAKSFSNGKAIVADGEMYSYIDYSGARISDEQYQYAQPFSNHYAAVCRDNLWKYIDKNGNSISDFMFSFAAPATESNTAWVSIKEDEYFLISLISGERVSRNYFPVSEEAPFPQYNNMFIVRFSDGLGVIDGEGKEIVFPCFKEVFLSPNGEIILQR